MSGIPDHLGGFVAGGDPATHYPELWDWLYNEQGVRSVIDVGCGDGQALRHFEQLGCRVLGIEGVRQDHPRIVRHDYTIGPYVPDDRFDLCWCCEFVEHVEERYIGNFVATFRAASLLLMTHAFPGQGGWHHVNEQPAGYWIERLGMEGFVLDPELTELTRERASWSPHPQNHYLRSGLAFRNRGWKET